jgi:hypothetical protein
MAQGVVHLSNEACSCAMIAALLPASDAGAFAWLYFQRTGPAHLAEGENSIRNFGAICVLIPTANCACRNE